MKIYTLSSLIDNHQLFCKFAQDAYSATDCLCQDYPKYFEWYWSKDLPRVFNGTGEIVVCTIDDNIAGIASLKKINTEKKICTFFVVKEYRGQHVATKMLEYIFEYLGTSKPLITITDYKVLSFVPIIKKYNWKLTQITSKGYYNNASCEFVYNGRLPEWLIPQKTHLEIQVNSKCVFFYFLIISRVCYNLIFFRISFYCLVWYYFCNIFYPQFFLFYHKKAITSIFKLFDLWYIIPTKHALDSSKY